MRAVLCSPVCWNFPGPARRRAPKCAKGNCDDRCVKIFNPWNRDRYSGDIPNPSQKDGTFVMRLSEYYEAIAVTYNAHVEEGHSISAKTFSTSARDSADLSGIPKE